MASIAWNVTHDALVDRVTMECGPVSRLVPDGCRVEVVVYHDERDTYNHVDNQRGKEKFRVASVSLVDADGNRDKALGAVRFGNTEASGSCWARVIESKRYDRVDTGEVYWRTDHVTGWRLHGFADDLPDGAMQALRDVFADAAEFVAENFPELWAGADYKLAARRLEDAKRDAEKARVAIQGAKRDLLKATRAHDKACAKAAKVTA